MRNRAFQLSQEGFANSEYDFLENAWTVQQKSGPELLSVLS